MAQYYYGRDDNEYPVDGTVTISTKEYRNMIMELADAVQRCNSNYSECGQKDKEIQELTKKLEGLRQELDICLEFIGADSDRLGEYNRFNFEKRHEEC